MPNARTLSIGVALALLTFATRPAAAQYNATATAKTTTARSAETLPFAAASTFWTVLNDSTLDRLLAQALHGNLQLRAAAARADGVGATRMQAALELAPTVTASAGYTRQRLSRATLPGAAAGALPDQDLWDSGLNLSWEPDVFGRLRGSLRAQNALVASADAAVQATQVLIAAEVARMYFALRGAQNQLAVAQRNAANQQRTLELTVTRLEAGRGTAFDTERARAQLSFTQSAIPVLEAHIAATRYRIAVLVGRTPDEIVGDVAYAGHLPQLPDTVPSMTSADVVRARPDVLSAERNVAASKAATSSARADYLPRVSIAAGAGYLANAVDSFGNAGTFKYSFGPVISWPAFDMGRVKARVDAAQARGLEARAQYEHATLTAREEHNAATALYRATRARVAHLRDAAVASERAASLARLRYEGGVIDFLQVLDAERTLLAAQDQLARAETEAAEAYVALFRARGASWQSASASR